MSKKKMVDEFDENGKVPARLENASRLSKRCVERSPSS